MYDMLASLVKYYVKKPRRVKAMCLLTMEPGSQALRYRVPRLVAVTRLGNVGEFNPELLKP